MSRILDRAVRLALAMMVAGGLGFGVRAASAASGSAACPFNEGAGQIGLSCTASSQCTGPCQAYFGPESAGGCIKGCCVCAI